MNKVSSDLRVNMRGEEVATLHQALQALGLAVDPEDAEARRFGRSTRDAVAEFQKARGLEPSGEVDEKTAGVLNATLADRGLLGDGPDAPSGPAWPEKPIVVTGRITDRLGLPAAARVELLALAFQREDVVAKTKTDADGQFTLSPADPKAVPLNIRIRATDADGQVALSAIVFAASGPQRLDLGLGSDQPRERSRQAMLEAAIRPVIGDLSIGELKELPDRREISFLAGDRKIDAEDLARLAMAHRLARQSGVSPDYLFAILRQGAPGTLPASVLALAEDPDATEEVEAAVLTEIALMKPETGAALVAEAADKGLVAPWVAETAGSEIAKLQDLRPNLLQAGRAGAGKATLGDVLARTSLEPKERDRFVTLQIEAQSGKGLLWNLVAADPAFSDAKVRDLRATLMIGNMAKNHLPFLDYAKRSLPAEVLDAPGLLAAQSRADWEDVIRKGMAADPAVLPANIDGETEDARVSAFAEMLVERAERSFPAMALVGRATRADLALPEVATVAKAVAAVPDLNLRMINISAVRIGRQPAPTDAPEETDQGLAAAVKMIADLPEAAAADLKRLQRAHRLAPGAQAAVTLLAMQMDGADRIHAKGRKVFVREATNAGMTELEANITYGHAAATYGYLLARFLEYRVDLNKASPAAVPQIAASAQLMAEVDAEPSLRTLFGSLDSCSCDWCESVHGPAAYYTDVLRWLKLRDARAGSGFANALDVATARRPDLRTIKLNCQNTDTVLPYIDLVNEVLEEVVAPTGIARQTTWRAEELLAEPEHVNPAAYAVLAAAAHAPSLPFDLADLEMQVYLAHLRISRAELLSAFQNRAVVPMVPTDTAIAAAWFALNPAAAAIITGADPARQPEFWVFAAPNELVPEASVQVLLARADITYTDLSDLMATRFVNNVAPLSAFAPEFECDLFERRVTNLTLDRLDRMNRFLRLWRATGWRMWELDLAIQTPAIGNGVLNAATLERLMQIDRIRQRLRLSVEEAVSLVGPIDTRLRDWLTGDGRSHYADLFLDRKVTNPADPAFAVAAVTAAAPAATLAAKAATIAAVLALPAEDIARLMPPVADPDIALPVSGGALTLGALSQLHRFARLAKGLRLRIGALLDLCRLIGGPRNGAGRIDPFVSVAGLQQVLDAHDRIMAGLGLEETRHLLTWWPEAPFAPTDAAIATELQAVRAALYDLYVATVDVAVDERAVTLDRQLAALPAFADAGVRAEAISLVDDTFAGTPAARAAALAATFGTIMPLADAQAAFAPFAGLAPNRPAAIDARRQVALQAVYAALAEASVITFLAAALDLPDAVARHLLFSVRRGVGPTFGDLLLDPQFRARTADGLAFAEAVDRATMPGRFAGFAHAAKIALLVQRLGLSADELLWLFARAGQFGLPDLALLPSLPGHPAIATDAWTVLTRWLAAFRAWPETAAVSLRSMLDAIGTPGYLRDDLRDDLAVWSGRSRAEIGDLFNGFAFAYPADYQTVGTWERLFEALRIHRLAGVPPVRLFAWAGPAVAATAAEAKLAAKSRHTLDAWAEIARPLQDRLRAARRDALVVYLTSRPAAAGRSWRDPNALFAHFLIDTEMSPCRLTSRLVQATGSAQLFVQRCLMNLEPDVLADAEADDDWNQWQWMANYRVWEAARKVFLWPENVIRPELNTAKSRLLIGMEEKLAQVDLNEASAEAALTGYLEGLDEVANLTVQCTYDQWTPAGRVLHVLGRSRSEPPRWHYRTRVFPNNAAEAYWTPWQRLDLEIGGSPIFGYTNRKLHLLWLVFTEKPDPTMALPPATASNLPPPDPLMMWELQLGWSVLKQGSWTAPRIGKKKLIYPVFRPRSTFHLRTSTAGSGAAARINVDLYVSPSQEVSGRPVRIYSNGGSGLTNLDEFFSSFDLNLRPRHAGMFGFNGDVVSVHISSQSLLNKVRGSYGADGAEVRATGTFRPPITLPVGMRLADQAFQNQPSNLTTLNVTVDDARRLDTGTLLTGADAPFQLVTPAQYAQFDPRETFFYQDPDRAFHVVPSREWRVDGSFTTVEPSVAATPYRLRFRFDPFYHAFTGFFLATLATGGLKAFYKRSTQLSPPSSFNFITTYQPAPLTLPQHNTDIVDFSYAGAYSSYNWELFFHAPFLIAMRLAENRRYEEALAYLSFIFDPTNATAEPAPARYWITKPFHQMTAQNYADQRIERLLELVNAGSASHIAQVEQWRNDPFDPHKIARLRPVAYQRAVVAAYIDILLDWADDEFRRFSTESLNIATQLYIRAQDLLGRRPVVVPVDRRVAAKSFDEVDADLDAFSNLLAEVQNVLPPPAPGGGGGGGAPLPPVSIFYFCIPANARLLDAWDRVERNLFNLRHCRDIEGVERPLPLFSPPIDPAMLVQAAAAGVDLSTVAMGAAAALPHYRFRFVIQRAYAFSAEVERLGAALLSALERRDEAELERIRESHETALRDQILAAADHRIDEAKAELEALKAAKERAAYRKKYYEKKASQFVTPVEGVGLGLKSVSVGLAIAAAVLKAVAGGTSAIPGVQTGAAGIGGSPLATVIVAGQQIPNGFSKAADVMKITSELTDKGAELSFKIGYFLERMAKYEHERDLAEHDKKEVEKRIIAAEARLAFAKADKENEKLRLAQSREVALFLRSRYTSRELYDWMVAQISGVYFQAYRLAFDMAKGAAACAEREVGLNAMDFVGFGTWDSLRRGLLAGERLSQSLRRLEAAYMDRNRRLYEISKDVSLNLLDAEALLTLKTTGSCEFTLPEALFDLDFPGHYRRRLKSVAITLPCVTGPYTSVNARLTLLHDETRISPSLAGGYARGADDARFADDWSATSSIVTSKGQDDSGLFELRLDDDRYLPFEGAGAVGRWRLDLPPDTNAFDLDTLTDAILHLRYTATEGGEPMAVAARATASGAPTRSSAFLVRLDHAFAADWAGLVGPPAAGQDQALAFRIGKDRLPYLDRGREVSVTRVVLLATEAPGDLVARLTAPGGVAADVDLVATDAFDGRRAGETGAAFAAGVPLGTFTLNLQRDGAADFRTLTAADVAGLYAVVFYDAEAA
jgi:hypothetical protein